MGSNIFFKLFWIDLPKTLSSTISRSDDSPVSEFTFETVCFIIGVDGKMSGDVGSAWSIGKGVEGCVKSSSES